MKNRTIWLVVPAVVLSLGACTKKEEGKTPEAAAVVEKSAPAPESKPAPAPAPAPSPATGLVKDGSGTPTQPTATPTPAPAAVPKVAALSPDERAAKLGFVKHLPQDTEAVIAFHNGSKSVDRIQSSKLWKLIQAESGLKMDDGDDAGKNPPPDMKDDDFALPEEGEEGAAIDLNSSTTMLVTADGPDPGSPEAIGAAEHAAKKNAEDADNPEDVEPMNPSDLFGTEFTIALGKSCGEQTSNLLTLNRRMGYFQMRGLAKALVASAKSGDFSSMEDTMEDQFGPELFKNLLADPESGIALFEKMKMPPLYLAFRAKPAELPAAAQQLASLIENLGMIGEMVEPVEVEKAGQKFAGQKISGAKLSAEMAENRKDMEEVMEPATIDKLIAAIAKKDLVALSGTVGEYAILFVGSSVEDLNLAATPAQSLVATDALAFCDAYASKNLAAVIYGQKGAMDQMIAASGGLADMTNGIRDGLSGSEGLGDTRDLETLLRMVGDHEAALRKLASNESLGMAAFFEDGLKIESFGGTDQGAVNWNAPNTLASLGDAENVVMFANMTAEAAYDEKMRAYLEALMETSYAAAMKISDLPMEDEKMAEFKKYAKLFDTKFRPDVVALWDAFSGGFGSSLGKESALIVDLEGSMPAFPGVPQAVVDQGKIPRISMVAPVTDRAKLAASWQKMNASITNILGKVSEMAGEDIPMQKPISSEKDGYTTWFFSMPFFNDDFMPSVTVGDKWFAASTSKKQALDLVGKAAKGGEPRTGLLFTVNFKTLQKFSRETLKMVEKNADAITGAGGISKADMDMAAKAIEAMDDLDKLTIHARREGGVLRSSVHLKTR